MHHKFFAHYNFLALLVSAIVYWLIGTVWFSLLMGKIWSTEHEKHGKKIKTPTSNTMIKKSILTFVLNFVVAFGVSLVVRAMHSTTLMSGISLGIILGICFPAAVMATSYLWENRPLKLSLIDVGYPVIGITACSIIMSLWR